MEWSPKMKRLASRIWKELQRKLSTYTDVQIWRWRRCSRRKVEIYWRSSTSNNNSYMLNVLSEFSPDSVLELGSNCGPRLFAINRRWPEARLEGVDINAYAVSFGNSKLEQLGVGNVRLRVGRIEQLSRYADRSFDICFSWAALMYLRPGSISDVLCRAQQIARKAIVLFEMHSDALEGHQAAGELCGTTNWKRNYRQLFRDLGVGASEIDIRPIPMDVWSPGGGGGACIIVRRQAANHETR
jgi:hypothetical protein